ncbi:hypothetical protein ACVWW1_005407 [Bradyrhizobium sp. JR3.5]
MFATGPDQISGLLSQADQFRLHLWIERGAYRQPAD